MKYTLYNRLADTNMMYRIPHVSCFATYDYASRADLPIVVDYVIDIYMKHTIYTATMQMATMQTLHTIDEGYGYDWHEI